jgi:hypothetical protein
MDGLVRPLACGSRQSRHFGCRRRRIVEPEGYQELRAIDPARSFQDWEEWLRIVEPGKYLYSWGAKIKN